MWGVSTILFFGMRSLPGGPVEAMLGAQATEAAVESMRSSMGLDRPVMVQYVDFITDLLVLDFGTSFVNNTDINAVLMNTVPRTASIAFIALLVGPLIAIPAGVVSATRRGTVADHIATLAAFFGISVPSFLFGIFFILLFSVQLGVFPTYGYTPLSESPTDWFLSILLPGIATGLPYSAVTMRMLRSSLLEVKNQPYMTTARAKGLNPRVQLLKHAMQNALIPVVTVFGILVGSIFVSTVAVEIVFGINGVGRVLINSILDRDYQTTQAIIILVAGFMSLVILAMDIVYAQIDPRIEYN